MSKAVKNVETDGNQLVLIHRNQHNLFWHSTLFNEVYLQNDVPVFHTDVWIDDEVNFEQFLTQFQNYVETLEGENPNTWSERTTINRIIKPILEMLGYTSASNDRVEPWLEDESFSVQEADGVKTYKPDFIIVNDHKELKYIQNESKSDKKIGEARTSVILPIEAKYWGRIDEYRQNQKEDSKRADKKNNGDGSRVMDFDEQCLKYMEILNKQYGVLTDGKTWRLYNLGFSSPNYKPYFQFNLGHMIKHVQNSDFLKSNGDYQLFKEEIKYFYFLFRKKSLFSDSGEELFVDELLSYSKKYVARVEEDLKTRFVNAMTIACNGFQRSVTNKGDNAKIDLIRSVSESHIFNILFLKYCEARNILPIKQDPEGYRKISISNILDRLERFDPNKEGDNLNYPLLKRMFADINYDPTGYQLYERLLKLTKIVQDGTNEEFKGFTIKGFKESIYSKEEWKFAQNFKLSNQEMIRILFELGYSDSDIQGRKYQQIPYNSFSPRQLGSIYESFLEFKLEKAPEDLAFIKKQWVAANLKSEKIKSLDIPKVKKNELFFTPDNKDRKATGSYYTPDYIVQKILNDSISESLLKCKKSTDILGIKLCDPAMGSGHFLCSALNFLAKKYMEKLDEETHDDIKITISTVKRLILHNCIYGVDVNPRAVKLAKMSLWLESADSNDELEHLDDQIKCGESLVSFKWKNEFPIVFKGTKVGFDAVIGNPPYVSTDKLGDLKDQLFNANFATAEYQTDLYVFFIEKFMSLCNQNGSIGLIVPNSFLHYKTMERLRRFLFVDHRTKSITKAYDAFKELTVDTVILSCTKNTKDNSEIKLYDFAGAQLVELPPIKVSELGQDLNVNLSPKLLDDSIIKSLEKSQHTVADSFKIKAGIKIRPEFIQDSSNTKRHKPLLKGRNLFAFNIRWNKDQFVDYSKKAEEKYPNQSLRDPKIFEDPKILIRQTADDLISTVDLNGFVCMQSAYSIQAKSGKTDELYYLCCLLNSELVRNFYKTKFRKDKSTFPQIRAYDLEQLPYIAPSPELLKDAKALYIAISKEMDKLDSVDECASFHKLNAFVNEIFGVTKLLKAKKAA